MKTRSRAKLGVAEADLVECSRTSTRVKKGTSVSVAPQGVQSTSPVLPRRRTRVSKTAASLLPSNENSPNEEGSSTSSLSSPVCTQKVLPSRRGRLSQRVVPNTATLDKENKNAVRGRKQSKQQRAIAPLTERSNLVMQEKEGNIMVTGKQIEAADRVNTCPTPAPASLTQPPARRSNRNKNSDAAALNDQKAKRTRRDKAPTVMSHDDRRNAYQENVSKKRDEVCQLEDCSSAPSSTKAVDLKKARVAIPRLSDQIVSEFVRCTNRGKVKATTCRRAALNEKEKRSKVHTLKNNQGEGKSQTSLRLRGTFAVPKNPSPIHPAKLNTPRMLNKFKNSPSAVSQKKFKAPVWAALKSLPTPGRRKSIRIGQSAYEFPVSPAKVGTKKKVVRRKAQKRQKKIKPHAKLRLLTTDPDFEQQFSRVQCSSDSKQSGSLADISSLSSIRGLNEDTQDTVASIMDEEEFSADTIPSDDENVFEGFEGETVSSFVHPQPQLPKSSVPMTSSSVLPTPALSKHISKFIGGSSTPRVENVSADQEPLAVQAPVSVKDDIAVCFGFETDSESELEDLPLSPVRRSGLQNSLEVTGTSDINSQSVTQNSRFCLSTLKQSNKSNVSTATRHVLQQGQRKPPMAGISSNFKLQKSLLKLSVRKRGIPEKENFNPKCRAVRERTQPCRSTITKASCSENISCEEAETSVLFDDEEALEKLQNFSRAEGSLTTQSFSSPATDQATRNAFSPSPEKNFFKAPRKSYNRADLEASRREFIKACGGYATTETETETESDQEDVSKKLPEKRANTKAKALSKKRKKDLSKCSDINDTTAKKMKRSKKTKQDREFEKSFDEWASGLNNHFSEVDETFLVVH